jgi:hypothetical protein
MQDIGRLILDFHGYCIPAWYAFNIIMRGSVGLSALMTAL